MKVYRVLNILWLLPPMWALMATAQAPADRESLLVGPGDEIRITVFAAPELTQQTKVTDAGLVKLTLGGEIHLGGDTPIQAARAIEAVLRDKHYVLAPQVAVDIVRYATQTVSVIGEIKQSAAYPLDTPRSLIDVLAAAGGLNADAGRRIVIRRKSSGQKQTYYFARSGDSALDNAPLVYPGDEIFVPAADKYYMLGDFNRPGAYENTTNQPNVTLLQMLAFAGSTPPTASPAKARLVRKRVDGTSAVMFVDISSIQKGSKPDVPLEPNDVIYVPFSYLKNVALGAGAIVSSAASASVYKF